jgi:4-carboxymuconolactone decarboxylase
MTTDADRATSGERNRRKVLGDAHVDRSKSSRNSFNGEWDRPDLDWKKRSVVVLSVATALGRWEEFRIHVKGAVHNGLTREEIKEVLIQCAIYAGVPAANTAFHEAQKVFDEMDKA